MKLIINTKLPLPPTLNQYYRAKVIKGKPIIYKSDKGYFDKVACLVSKSPTNKRLKIAVTVHFSDKRTQDIDNRLKALLDALNGRIWADDSQIDKIEIDRGEIIKGGLVKLKVWELD